jgi:hypothetical protein
MDYPKNGVPEDLSGNDAAIPMKIGGTGVRMVSTAG